VYGFLLRLVGDHAEAEDLALEAFLRLYRQPPAALTLAGDSASPDAPQVGKTADPIGGWLHRVATNLGLNAIRGWKRRQRYELEAGRSDLRQRSQAGQESNPAELFQAEEERQRVRRILSEMNPRQARLLVMRHSGLPYREIAAGLGVAPASIGPLLARAENDFERRFRAAYPENNSSSDDFKH
jgi:RNA polymerase sigma-70 factor (ECF subfamily)